MKRLTEGQKMFAIVMIIFLVYAIVILGFEGFDRNVLHLLNETSDWYLLAFSLVVMLLVGAILHRYARRMDRRISREQLEWQAVIRREMTQNIAHELKTPVASILGYMETLLCNPGISAETQHQFIVRSHAQAQRLTNLLQDLSILNRMDYAQDVMDREETDLSQMVKDIVMETALALEARQMTFDNQLPDRIVIHGISSLLYGIFRNLTDNAIHYAGAGTTVTLSAIELSGRWLFAFSDNGIGVPDEHLPRLFERFYRIDKGRSRQLGGTGLGLSIVKNAILLHGGTITVRNNPAGGLCFEFSLRKG